MNDKYEFFFSGKDIFSNWYENEFLLFGETFHCGEQAMMWAKAKIFGDNDKATSVISIYNPETVRIKDIQANITSNDIAQNHLSIDEINKIIGKINKPKFIKQKGREVSGFNQRIWDNIKTRIMYMIIHGRFNKKTQLHNTFMKTGKKIFVEASPYDKIWGIELNKATALKTPKHQWPGQNLLGKMLTKYKKDVISNNVKIFSINDIINIGYN